MKTEKRMVKRLALILSIALVIACIPAAAFAAGADNASVITDASYPGAKSVVVNSSTKTIVITVPASASDTLDKSKLSVTTAASGYTLFTKSYTDSTALTVSHPVTLEVSYQESGSKESIPTRYSTIYTVSAVKGAHEDPSFSGSLSMKLEKGTNKTIDYTAIKNLYTQNDGAALEYFEFSDLTSIYSVIVGGKEYTDLSTGLTIAASKLSSTVIRPIAAGSSTMSIKAYQKGDADPVGEAVMSLTISEPAVIELNDLSAEVDNSEALKFSEINFVDAFRTKTNQAMTYISFTLPDSSCGTLVTSYNSLTKASGSLVTDGTLYSASQLSDITFVPAEKYSGSFWLYYIGTDGGVTKNGRVRISVNATTTDELTYSISSDEPKYLSVSDIKSVLKEATGEKDFTSIKFTSLPPTGMGVLYYQPTGITSKSIVTTGNTYVSSGSGMLASDLLFVPASSGTAQLKYTVYTESNTVKGYTGTITFNVSASTYDLPAVNYNAAFNKNIVLNSADFASALSSRTTKAFDYIVFDLPASFSTKYGSLLLNYTPGQTGFSVVTDTVKYYASATPSINNITFVPVTGFSGTVAVPYTAYDTTGIAYTGRMNITIKSAGTTLGEITYTVANNSTLYLKSADINAKFAALTNVNFDYITFKLPSYGSLMSHYLNTVATNAVKEGDKYYRTSGSLVDMVFYQPLTGASGDVTITYYAYNKDLDDTYTGTIKITVSKAFNNTYTDVSEDSPYYDGIKWAVTNNIYTGASATKYGVTTGCTRAECVYFLWKAAGSPEPKSLTNNFIDVSTINYYYKAVLWAVGEGVTQGTSDNYFTPSKTVTRGQAMTFFWRQLGKPAGGSENKFKDVSKDSPYYDAILWAVSKGVTTGTTTTSFSPNQTCNIGQIVTFLYRNYK